MAQTYSYKSSRRRPLRSPPKRKSDSGDGKSRKFAPILDVIGMVVGFLFLFQFIAWYWTIKSVHSEPELNHLNVRNTIRKEESTAVALLLSNPANIRFKKIHRPIRKQITSAKNTIVSAYFILKSKHSSSEYDNWMKNALSLQDAMVIFTQSEMVEKIFSLRQHALDRTVVIEMNLADLPITRLKGNTSSAKEFWRNQLAMDPEKNMHRGHQVFWIWLSKSWFLSTAVRHNFFQSNLFMYSDIGSFRRPRYNGKELIQNPGIIPPKTVVWMAHRKINPPAHYLWTDKLGEKEHYYTSGSSAIGSGEAWLTFHKQFAQVVDAFIAANLFIGEDQCVLQGVCLLHPENCAYLPHTEVKDNNYFGLRYALFFKENKYKLWRAPQKTYGALPNTK